jgi:predicted nucleotide-binding protein
VPRIFIVHGHDEVAKYELKNFLQNSLKLGEPVVLQERRSNGRTVIEKFEEEAAVADVVFILFTPDETGKPHHSETARMRARPNVLFEAGYFYGRLQRTSGKVIFLVKGDIELPSDVSGIVYIDISRGIQKAAEEIRRELAEWLE